jgi:hypothetical protein
MSLHSEEYWDVEAITDIIFSAACRIIEFMKETIAITMMVLYSQYAII